MIAPLNGVRTHPLTDSTRLDLARIAKAPVPRQEINPGAANRLLRGALVRQIMMASPYKTHKKGRVIAYLEITDAGRAELATTPYPRQLPHALKGALASSAKLRGKIKHRW